VTPTSKWKKYRLDEIAFIQGGGTPRRSEAGYFGGSVPWVTPKDLPAIGLVTELSGTKETITEAGLANSSAKLIEPGSILFSSRASVGKIAVTNVPCATNQGFANFTPDPERIDCWFLAFLLCRYTREIIELASKTTFLEVPRGKLKGFRVAIPSLSEQRRIVSRIKECMERVEEIEGLRAEANQEIDFLIPASLEDIFYKNGFEEIPLFDLLREKPKNGVYLPKSDYTQSGGVPMVRMGEMFRRFEVDEQVERSVKSKKKLIEDYGLLEGDVLVARRSIVYEGSGSMAIVTKTNQGSIFESSIIRLRFNEKRVLPAFIVAFFHSREGLFRRMSITKKATISGVNQEGLKRLTVPCPTIKHQQEVLKRVAEVRDSCSAICEILPRTEISNLRESILRRAFAGGL
jgi:type I restriction enzyme S subunit